MLQRPKYNANKTEIDGIKFDSKIEAKYYEFLKRYGLEFKHHPIYELQPRFQKDGNIIQPIKYEADFSFYDGNGKEIVIDIKGMPTSDSKLKRKMFIYKYPEKELKRLVWYKQERVDYFENEKRKSKNKKDKKELENI